MGKLAVIAIGGNSLITDGNHQSVEDQYKTICTTAGHVADLIEYGYEVVISHGNGPQVGFILRRSEIAAETLKMHPVPLVNCDANTQGAIGYQIQQAMDNEFRRRNIKVFPSNSVQKKGLLKTAVTVVTQVAVDKNDPAFSNPSKPIGSFYSEEQVKQIREKYKDWALVNDAGRGYRRVVPSPMPLQILEQEAIETLLEEGFCVVAAGGGGIPVVKTGENQWEGVDAVIDKDFASSLLAKEISADLLIISTGVEKVYLNFGKSNQVALDKITVVEAKKYIEDGHFSPGSMLPKIEAAIKFLEGGGKEAIITDPQHLHEAAVGKAGTHIMY